MPGPVLQAFGGLGLVFGRWLGYRFQNGAECESWPREERNVTERRGRWRSRGWSALLGSRLGARWFLVCVPVVVCLGCRDPVKSSDPPAARGRAQEKSGATSPASNSVAVAKEAADRFVEALRTGNGKEVLAQIDGGRNPNAYLDDGLSPLMIAAESGRLDMVRILLERDALPDIRSAVEQTTALAVAARHGHENIVALLLKRGAQVKGVDVMSSTPLHYAAREGHLPVVDTLIRMGAPVTLTDKAGGTALSLAAMRGHHEVCRLLVEKGADVDGSASARPLQAAARSGSAETVRTLLEAGAVPDAIDTLKRTALDEARVGGNPEIIRMIEEALVRDP